MLFGYLWLAKQAARNRVKGVAFVIFGLLALPIVGNLALVRTQILKKPSTKRRVSFL